MSTYASLHYHVVFSTKHRTNFIHRSWEERLHKYIANQRKHHRVKSFQEELIEMLEKAGVDYDPKYLN